MSGKKDERIFSVRLEDRGLGIPEPGNIVKVYKTGKEEDVPVVCKIIGDALHYDSKVFAWVRELDKEDGVFPCGCWREDFVKKQEIDKTLIRNEIDVDGISRIVTKQIVGHFVDPLNNTSLEIRKRVRNAVENIVKEINDEQ